MLEWCKATLAESRRPYGIDHFDLAIAYRSGSSTENQYFKRLRPLSLYEDDFARELQKKLKDVASRGGAEALLVSAACFSWGEAAAHILLPS